MPPCILGSSKISLVLLILLDELPWSPKALEQTLLDMLGESTKGRHGATGGQWFAKPTEWEEGEKSDSGLNEIGESIETGARRRAGGLPHLAQSSLLTSGERWLGANIFCTAGRGEEGGGRWIDDRDQGERRYKAYRPSSPPSARSVIGDAGGPSATDVITTALSLDGFLRTFVVAGGQQREADVDEARVALDAVGSDRGAEERVRQRWRRRKGVDVGGAPAITSIARWLSLGRGHGMGRHGRERGQGHMV
jgi:hypothetical protein